MRGGEYRKVSSCRVCGSARLHEFLVLGDMPLANAFISPRDVSTPEARFPLALVRCTDCGLVSLTVVVAPEILFRTYPYASSSSPPLLGHFDELASAVARRFAGRSELVVEIGSNDGVLLAPLRARGLRAVGIEPAKNLAAVANEAGLETWNEFFSVDVAAAIVQEKGPAKAVLANNVIAHIDDLHGLVSGLNVVLDDAGVLVAEFPYLVDLIEQVEYDTVYHEHLSYFSIRPLQRLFREGGLELFDVERLPIHGGSLRVFVGRPGRRALTPNVRALEQLEATYGLDSVGTYQRFAGRVAESREALREMVGKLRSEGRRVAAYGATAKGNTLLNYCDLGPDQLEFVADTTPFKQGLLTPGQHIPVIPDAEFVTRRPDYTVLLAWNYAEAILRRHSHYVSMGGRFIHPLPLARVL